MVTPSPASIVVVDFPFSDLSGSKLRPAVVLCDTGTGIISVLQKVMPAELDAADDMTLSSVA